MDQQFIELFDTRQVRIDSVQIPDWPELREPVIVPRQRLINAVSHQIDLIG
jgi:hypothetical protein